MRKEKKIRQLPGWIDSSYLCHMTKSWCIVKFSTCFRSQILHVAWLVQDNLVKIKIFNKEYKSTLLISCDWEHKLSIERPCIRWPICVFFLMEDYFLHSQHILFVVFLCLVLKPLRFLLPNQNSCCFSLVQFKCWQPCCWDVMGIASDISRRQVFHNKVTPPLAVTIL